MAWAEFATTKFWTYKECAQKIMPIGLICNLAAVFAGGITGGVLKARLSQRMKDVLPLILGICAMVIGINSIIKVHSLPPVIIAVIIGTVLGEVIHLEDKLKRGFGAIIKVMPIKDKNVDMEQYLTVAVLFCASGFGYFGVLTEGMTGDPSILLSKSVMDFFTGMIFATALGFSVSIIVIPQAVIFTALYLAAGALSYVVNDVMLANFISCGGVLTFASGFRVAKIKQVPIGSMIPALILVMPLSYYLSLIGI